MRVVNLRGSLVPAPLRKGQLSAPTKTQISAQYQSQINDFKEREKRILAKYG